MLKVKFHDVGEGLHEGKVFEISVKEGDHVTEGQTLFSVETDKLATDIPSPKTGKIVKIHIHAGQTIHVGQDVMDIE